MTSTCEPSHYLSFKNLEIPPRKLHCSHGHAAMNLPYETRLHRYLPSNKNNPEGDDYDDETDPYGTDHFRMYEFKVRKCTRSRSHDWTDCPFAHPGEKARRRDPNRYLYSSTICSDFRHGGGSCPRGDDCDFAHGVFECWLHPTRYRTEACKDGKNCKRKVCFFAHSPRELRLLPEPSPKYKNSDRNINYNNNNNHCCLFCNSVTSSPTSTLLGLSHFSRSPSSSPPLSPLKHRTPGFSPVRRSKFGTEMTAKTTYDDALLKELMFSLENMNFHEAPSPMAPASTSVTADANANGNFNPWIDVSFKGEDTQQQQPPNGVGYDHDLDLGWVNELLM